MIGGGGEGGEGQRGAPVVWRAAVCAERMAAAIEKSPSGGWEEKTAPHDLPASGADYPYLKTVCRGRRPPLTPPDIIPPPPRRVCLAVRHLCDGQTLRISFPNDNRVLIFNSPTVDEDPKRSRRGRLPPTPTNVVCIVLHF